MDYKPTACFALKPSATNPQKLITNYGYYPRVKNELLGLGYRVAFKDLTPHPNPSVFEPLWSRTKNVAWRHKQKETIEAILSNPYGRIDCPTGYGKSFIIQQIARLLPKATIHVTTKGAKVIRDIHKALSVALPDVGLIGAGKNSIGHRVQCFCADSLHRSDGKADILLADEGHELAAQSYLEQLAKYRYTRMYMFSASQDQRLDKRDFELEGIFGPIIMQIKYQEALRHDMIVDIEVRWRDVHMQRNPCDGMQDTFKDRFGIWRNDYRNSLIAEDARSYPDEQVLILVDTIEHGLYIRKLLPEFTFVYAQNGLSVEDRFRYENKKLMTADDPIMTSKLRAQYESDFESGKLKKAIATGIWNQGVNFHKLQVLIRADAGGSPIGDTQLPGRVCRLSDGKAYGVVHDYRDQFDEGLERRAHSRRRNYAKHGWKQIDVDAGFKTLYQKESFK